MELEQPRSKNPWVAALLAAALGPFGMAYSTYLGAFLMFPLFILALFLGGWWWAEAVNVGCIVWAFLAARD
jgi:hypothetical protein